MRKLIIVLMMLMDEEEPVFVKRRVLCHVHTNAFSPVHTKTLNLRFRKRPFSEICPGLQAVAKFCYQIFIAILAKGD